MSLLISLIEVLFSLNPVSKFNYRVWSTNSFLLYSFAETSMAVASVTTSYWAMNALLFLLGPLSAIAMNQVR